uniref:uncharacterized protein LOC122779330 isoform X6 n=1 Tax=Solea senegalensis TaxID=28829 RepID=UPI001CD8C56C|nr:uncharacterized protein LOC122779330 isoform X6 [Solea senegalensis]
MMGYMCNSDLVKGFYFEITQEAGCTFDSSLTVNDLSRFVHKFTQLRIKIGDNCVCIDASREDNSLGRLVNDQHKGPNCRMKKIDVDGKPHLCLFAIKDINEGEEITYDYGGDDCPWRIQASTHAEHEPFVDGAHADVPSGPQVDDDAHDITSNEHSNEQIVTNVGNEDGTFVPKLRRTKSIITQFFVMMRQMTRMRPEKDTIHLKSLAEETLPPTEENDIPPLHKRHKLSSAEDDSVGAVTPVEGSRNKVPSTSKRSKPPSGKDDRLRAVTSVKVDHTTSSR